MCYSAMVQQGLKELGKRFGARVDISIFEELFERRARGEKINLSKALEQNFANPVSAPGKKIKNSIIEFRTQQIAQLESDLFAQITRLNSANASVQKNPAKATKRALQEQAVARRQIERIKKRLEKIKPL